MNRIYKTKTMTAFEMLPSRIRYYLLEWKDVNMEKVRDCFDKTRLHDLTKRELVTLFRMATKNDSMKMRQKL